MIINTFQFLSSNMSVVCGKKKRNDSDPNPQKIKIVDSEDLDLMQRIIQALEAFSQLCACRKDDWYCHTNIKPSLDTINSLLENENLKAIMKNDDDILRQIVLIGTAIVNMNVSKVGFNSIAKNIKTIDESVQKIKSKITKWQIKPQVNIPPEEKNDNSNILPNSSNSSDQVQPEVTPQGEQPKGRRGLYIGMAIAAALFVGILTYYLCTKEENHNTLSVENDHQTKDQNQPPKDNDQEKSTSD